MNFVDHKSSNFKSKLEKTKLEKRLGIHSFHRYYGKLIPAIPKCAIREFTKPGDVVFDPFVGSGTTAVESISAGRQFIGVEINPLSVMISQIKTSNYDIKILEEIMAKILYFAENDDEDISECEIPFCVNRDRWFKDFVQRDLIKIKRAITKSVMQINCSDKLKYEKFSNGVLSAIVKQVSNADTMHVFPGISKRMRKLEAEGKIHIEVLKTFERAFKKRISYVEEFGTHEYEGNIINNSSADFDAKSFENAIDLIVTNPPYISSVRYAETLKLELYWMGVCKNANDYKQLSEAMIGNDRIAAKECVTKNKTQYDFINRYIDDLYEIDKKQSKVVYDFFTLMEKVIKNLWIILKPNKKLVMKISDSKIRKIKIPTGKLLTQIAEANGFKLIDVFNDKINEHSRSLLTARNSYSDIILEDNIIIWEKIDEK